MDMPRKNVNQHLPANPVLQTGSDPLCTKDYPKRLAPLEVAMDGGKSSTVALHRQQFIPHLHKNEIIHDHWLVFVAFEGRKGSLLNVYSAREGSLLKSIPLASAPAFDGMIAANGRIYMATNDGKLVCKRRFWVFVSSINKISYVFEAADYQSVDRFLQAMIECNIDQSIANFTTSTFISTANLPGSSRAILQQRLPNHAR
jgi:hypothetical protein